MRFLVPRRSRAPVPGGVLPPALASLASGVNVPVQAPSSPRQVAVVGGAMGGVEPWQRRRMVRYRPAVVDRLRGFRRSHRQMACRSLRSLQFHRGSGERRAIAARFRCVCEGDLPFTQSARQMHKIATGLGSKLKPKLLRIPSKTYLF